MNQITLLDAVTTDTTGTNLKIPSPASRYIVQIVGDMTFTCDIEGSLDGINWSSLASVTVADIVEVSYVPYIRARTSGMAGGATVTANAITV